MSSDCSWDVLVVGVGIVGFFYVLVVVEWGLIVVVIECDVWVVGVLVCNFGYVCVIV